MRLYILFVGALFWLVACKSKESNDFKGQNTLRGVAAFKHNIVQLVDSFISIEPQRDRGIFSIHYSRRLEGAHMTVMSINHENSLDYLGLPYYYEEKNGKLILYYNGTEVFEKKKYSESNFKKEFKEYAAKYNLKANEGRIVEPPKLELDISVDGTISDTISKNFYLWFSDIAEEEFQPPTTE